MISYEEYLQQTKLIQEQIKSYNKDITKLNKSDGHEFRNKYHSKHQLNLNAFNKIIIDNNIHTTTNELWMNVGGTMKYDDLSRYMIEHYSSQYLPAIVPELLSITVGGAISGIGIETSSFKYGLVHDTVIDMDVLLSDGRVVTCSATENVDLFTGLPNSYGTLGYILRAKIRIIPSKPYIQLHHLTFTNLSEALDRLAQESSNIIENDYLEGIVYSPTNIHLLIGRFTATLPDQVLLNDFNLKKPFYKSIEENDIQSIDHMNLYDYLSRWDVDGFWGTNNTILQNSIFRYYFRNYMKTELWLSLSKNDYFQYFYNFFSSSFLSSYFSSSSSPPTNNIYYEKITTDNGIPLEHWNDYIEWYYQQFPDSTPVWLCPFQTFMKCPLLTMRTNTLFCDFGTFSYEVKSEYPDNKKYYNEMIEKKIFDLNGMKCFYSMNCNKEYYERIVNEGIYKQLKEKYDNMNKFPMLKDKVFL